MSDPTAGHSQMWPALNLNERRVLGVLIEKAKTTPDAYPLSINALVTGCNQKSNREPILSLDDGQVEEALESLQKKLYTIRITGGSRTERWRHNLYEAWRVDKVELAILGELLLRGPQTEGELRGRASRMEPIEDLATLRKILIPLRDRKLIVYLTAQERRGTVLTHGFHGDEETAHLKTRLAGAGGEFESAPAQRTAAVPVHADSPGHDALEKRLDTAEEQIAALKETLARMQAALDQVSAKVEAIAKGLGM